MEITIREILAQLRQQLQPVSETASLDAQVLVAHTLKKPRTWTIAHPEAPINTTQYHKIIRDMDRIEHGEPLPYVIEHWEFYGLDFHLTPSVLIPRPETELLVERGINWLQLHPPKHKVVDVGTGSGCIGITLAKNIPDLQLILTDISQEALSVAKINAEKYGLLDRMEFLQADLLDGVHGPFDLICANLPYIPTPKLMKLLVADSEPRLALDGGLNGTEVISRLLGQAKGQLISGGKILLEIESSLGDELKTMAMGYYPASKVQILRDLSGLDRCLEIERPDLIVHLCQRQDWLKSQPHGIYRSKSLGQEGFIHCSQPEQIVEVANRYYQGIPEMVLLWIAPHRVTSEIRWESANGERFPHIYGPINLDAVVNITGIKSDINGIYQVIQFPD